MKSNIKNIIIKHIAGSRKNNQDSFSISKTIIEFGRAEDNAVQFDPAEESMVSRNHCKISNENGRFTLTDLDSLNGTYLNGIRISDQQVIKHGDDVMLGLHGPQFVVEFDPAPQVGATQLFDLPRSDAATRELSTDGARIGASKEGIGKHTLERVLTVERKKSLSGMLSIAGAALLLLTTLGYTFKDKLRPKVVNTNTVVVEEAFNPEVIAREGSDKVVFIEYGFKLIHTGSGDDVYHQYRYEKDSASGKERLVALYIETAAGNIEPLLGLKKDVNYGKPIAQAQLSGSGFIVDEDGFILTNRHVAASWSTMYTFPEDAQVGYLYQIEGGQYKITGTTPAPYDWVPSESKFFGEKPITGKILEGQTTYMDVTFAKSDQRTPAKIVRVSNSHDVAMIKVDLPGKLHPVVLNDSDDHIAIGQKIAVMGYPGISPEVGVVKMSNDFSNRNSQILSVPDPTLTDGTIGKIIRGSNQSADNNVGGYFSTLGHYYQLTASETGSGNSGGPVFDKDGKVIGIFSASSTSAAGDGRVTFAIPIKYGIDLMHSQRVIK